ncbi:mannose-1-phosphate guanylyltransferase/mannose-6-phosphate isomerase [Zavarzinia sp. CC-PAN008]|uniref:mannose-1-phosphate guanylyltransferase/mannose-6-phosphate isomerase n=1 Tax=Zavarzinia sp. CC-PAN008 TaxID=3243332 RepID=UPI003F744C79
MTEVTTIQPVILCGGSGTRLWPLSRTDMPKQLLPLAGDRTLLQETAARATGPAFAAPMLVAAMAHRFQVVSQLEAIQVSDFELILEPCARNTAPAIALAALRACARDGESLLLVMPADHMIRRNDHFLAAVERATHAARLGHIVTFGIQPTEPATGFGYIVADRAGLLAPGCARVERFVEKPDQETAAGLIAAGNCSWNAGIFLLRADVCLSEIERHAPEVLAACEAALEAGRVAGRFVEPAEAAFAAAPSISIDHAVMERTEFAAVAPVDMGWSDVGSWSALWDVSTRGPSDNVVVGDVIAEDVSGSYLRSDGALLTVFGVQNLVVVRTGDAVLVAGRERSQDLKRVVERLAAAKRTEVASHSVVTRPWGTYQSIAQGNGYQVKRIIVRPGQKLSMQYHHHRAEHWIVVRGTARVTCDDEVKLYQENQSTFIPLGACHRLENPGKIDLELIEVQSGTYLGEDDIVRVQDVYGRAAE